MKNASMELVLSHKNVESHYFWRSSEYLVLQLFYSSNISYYRTCWDNSDKCY